MPWNETEPMLEREKFVVAVKSGELTFTAQCERFGISRKTGYKLMNRFEAEGLAGLADRSRAPGHCPHALSSEVVGRILALKQTHPTWGPRKLRDRLKWDFPEQKWPARSTVGELLARHGLVKSPTPRRRTPAMSTPLSHAAEAHDVWSIDFKGHCQLGNGRACYPLTVTDNAIRYVLSCRGLYEPRRGPVQATLAGLFREHGLPRALRSDNGPPFASTGVGGLSKLAVWLIHLGVRPERIVPGRPQQNGRHERMHRTLKAEAMSPPSATLAAQQRRFDAFVREFNDERPHEALGGRSPSSLYVASPRAYPRSLPEVAYPDGLTLRRVRSNGEFKWKGGLLFLSEALVGELVGLKEVGELLWQIQFGEYPLGVLDERRGGILRPA